MSVDREYNIRIGTQADISGAQQAQEGLKQLGDAQKDLNAHLPEGAAAWQKYKGALGETEEEGKKLEASHRALDLAMEKLGLPAHELGILLKGLFNPATVSLVALTGAWEIWNKRIEEGTQALTGFQLPDLSEHVRQLSQAAEAAKAYQEALDGVLDKFNSIDAASDRAIAKINEEYEDRKKIAKAEGQKDVSALDTEEGQKEIEAKLKRKADLEKSSALKKQQAEQIHVASKDEDEANMADAKAQAEAAKKGKEESNKNLELIQRLRDAKLPNPADVSDYFFKFGGTSGTDAEAIEKRNLDSADEVIKRYDNLVKSKSGRDALREKREKLLKESGTEAGEAATLSQTIPDDTERLGRSFMGENLTKAIELSRRAGAGGSLNASESQFLQMLGSQAAGQNVSLSTAEKMFEMAGNKTSVLNSYLERLLQLFERMPNQSAYESRIAALESKFIQQQRRMESWGK